MRVSTETGSVYEFDKTNRRVRRVEHTHDLRRDGDWLSVRAAPRPQIGQPMVLLLEPLGEGNVTVRTTSPVTSIQETAGGPSA